MKKPNEHELIEGVKFLKTKLDYLGLLAEEMGMPPFLFPHVMATFCGDLAKHCCRSPEEQVLQSLFDSMQHGYNNAECECTCNKEDKTNG